MKVFDLRCAQGHGFEGWFASGDAFDAQHAADLIECPVCGNTQVVKLLTAPRLNLSGAKESGTRATPAHSALQEPGEIVPLPSTSENPHAAHWARAVREVLSRTEDVGERFAEEARRIHYGESKSRAIRGRATHEQAEALVEEGIEVLPLQVAPVRKQTLQ